MSTEIEPVQPTPAGTRQPIPPAPIHPLSALATIVLDNVFGVFEIVDPFALLITSAVVGVLGTVTTMMVQRYLSKDSWGASVAKGLVMGIFAGVPFQVTGTAVGVPLLMWAGLHELIKLPITKNKPQESLPPSEDIIETQGKDPNQ